MLSYKSQVVDTQLANLDPNLVHTDRVLVIYTTSQEILHRARNATGVIYTIDQDGMLFLILMKASGFEQLVSEIRHKLDVIVERRNNPSRYLNAHQIYALFKELALNKDQLDQLYKRLHTWDFEFGTKTNWNADAPHNIHLDDLEEVIGELLNETDEDYGTSLYAKPE